MTEQISVNYSGPNLWYFPPGTSPRGGTDFKYLQDVSVKSKMSNESNFRLRLVKNCI